MMIICSTVREKELTTGGRATTIQTMNCTLKRVLAEVGRISTANEYQISTGNAAYKANNSQTSSALQG